MKTVFEKSVSGRQGVWPKDPEARPEDFLPEGLVRSTPLDLPELSELDVVRHFTLLSKRNFGVDGNFYPLGSCTMKYNPKFTEQVAAMPGFAQLHPHLCELPGGHKLVQGALAVVHHLEEALCEITGMAGFSLQPMAGAHGELAGALIMAAYHAKKGNKKTKIICPDSAHGTNPASAAMAGFDVVSIPSTDGLIDPETLAKVLDDETAGIMMTCPNTLGLFEKHLPTIVEMVHAKDALLYYDGANLNAVMGKMRMGDAGFDVMHVNLHKTFGTPHGGGGPGSGPVGVAERLVPFLPAPRVVKDGELFTLSDDFPDSIGRMSPFFGNFAVALKAYAYILRLGGEGLTRVSENAVLAANYLRARIREFLDVPFDGVCMHEFVASAAKLSADKGVRALDLAKALLDRGIHAPTVYFPLIVAEALMVEPTETESLETLDGFVKTLRELVELAGRDPDIMRRAPEKLSFSRFDETKAARELKVVDESGHG